MNIDSNKTNAPSDALLECLERALIAGRMSRRNFMRAATAAGFASVGLSALADELDAIRANQNARSAKLQASCDYVVVGTGSAACALVGRLATRKEASILMIEAGDWDTAPWKETLVQCYERLTKTEVDLAESGSDRWERRNKAFHEALIAGFNSSWSKYFLAILYRHGERYRNINWRLTAAHTSGRDVHQEHEAIFRAAIDRQEARAALALEAHIRLTHDVVRLQASQAAVK